MASSANRDHTSHSYNIVKKKFHRHHLLKFSILKPYESLFHNHFRVACRYFIFFFIDLAGAKNRFIKKICSEGSTFTATEEIFVREVADSSCCFDQLWFRFFKK